VDSGFVFAYVNEKDPHHSSALPLMEKILVGEYGKIFISNLIVNEAMTLSMIRTKSCGCAKTIDDLLSIQKDSRQVFFPIYVDSSIIERTTKKFHKFCPKGLSFTDCTILVIMEMFSIPSLATFDSHFKGIVTTFP